jgi:transmembrane sensor
MKHDPYSLTELIRNDDFIAWVRQPNEKNNAHWRQFLEENPGKRQTVESARNYVILMGEDTGKNQPSREQSNKMWSAVESHLRREDEAKSEESAPDEELQQIKILSPWRWARIAASVALIAGMTSFSYWYYTNQAGYTNDLSIHENAAQNLVTKNNLTSKPMMVLLSDGSSVVLQPESSLSYTADFGIKNREVSLKGKAFFEIVKNADKPFLVYTFGLATKVLGTSFLICAPEHSKEIKVEVITGKVSVFTMDESEHSKEQLVSKELKGFIINPSQKISFSREDGKFTKSAVAHAMSDADDISKQDFIFDETPVSEVFVALEKAYNIKISYDESLMKNCPLNATLIGQPIHEKLSVICNALDAQFEIQGNEVKITGAGCR